jgi:hypothetical protein
MDLQDGDLGRGAVGGGAPGNGALGGGAVGGGARRDSVAWAAELALAGWVERVGRTGMTAARAMPGLLAAVDQHAAAVRDALADREGGVARCSLAAYADGVADTALQHGWDGALPSRSGWSRAPWPVLRLLAVCQLAGATATSRK